MDGALPAHGFGIASGEVGRGMTVRHGIVEDLRCGPFSGLCQVWRGVW